MTTEPSSVRAEDYLAMVREIALPFVPHGERIEDSDVWGDGMLGLAEAIRNYDAVNQGAFSTYAWHCIRSKIISGYRRSKRHLHRPSINNEAEIVAPAMPIIENEEMRERLHVHLSRLEEEDSPGIKIFIYYHTVCPSWRKVGKEFGIPKSTAQMQAKKAELRIRHILNASQGELK
jgi:RNA polymerase sigma factor (sigma-70 family)